MRKDSFIQWGTAHQLVSLVVCTALSDIEVEHEPIKGKLYHIFYPLEEDARDLSDYCHDSARNPPW